MLHTNKLLQLITGKSSSVRGIFIGGVFTSCVQAGKQISSELNSYAKKDVYSVLAKNIPSSRAYTPDEVKQKIYNTYHYFTGNTKKSSQILLQNITINALRSGIKNYAAETGSVASMVNMSNTMAMNNTRMSWATSSHIGVETLPLMQVVLLLLMVCVFPLIALLTLIPGLGLNIFKNYIYSLIWLESWPVMFTVLNMAMNFYIKNGHADIVTLSSINRLAQEHSDIAGIAGYLILAVPFLSLGLTKGMAYTFNSAAQYLGGMLHSIAQGSASQVSMGNYSLGNISTANATSNMLSANKHDTNFTNMHGMHTNQLANGVTATSTTGGEMIYNVGAGMSQLATSTTTAQSVASSLSHQAELSYSSAQSHMAQYSSDKSHNESMGGSATTGVSSQVDHAINYLNNLSSSATHSSSASESDSFNKNSNDSVSASATEGLKERAMVFGNGVAFAQTATESGGTSESSDHGNKYTAEYSNNIGHTNSHEVREATQVLMNYGKTHTLSNSNSETQNEAIRIGQDLSRAVRQSESAQFIESHSDAINTNFSQGFTNFIEINYPEQAEAILSATGNSPMLEKQETLANQYITTHAHQLAQEYRNSSNSITQNNNDPKYKMDNYHHDTDNLGIDRSQQSSLNNQVSGSIHNNQERIANTQSQQMGMRNKMIEKNASKIDAAEVNDKRGFCHTK